MNLTIFDTVQIRMYLPMRRDNEFGNYQLSSRSVHSKLALEKWKIFQQQLDISVKFVKKSSKTINS